MSEVTKCPVCEKNTEHSALGVIQGRNLFQCRKMDGVEKVVRQVLNADPVMNGCNGLWEKIEVRIAVGKRDKVREALV